MQEIEHRDCAIAIARLDERIIAQDAQREAQAVASSHALQIASQELARRLDLLNNEQSRIDRLHGQMMTRELFDFQHNEVLNRLTRLEGDFREQTGKLWLPLIGAAAVAAGLGAAVAKLL